MTSNNVTPPTTEPAHGIAPSSIFVELDHSSLEFPATVSPPVLFLLWKVSVAFVVAASVVVFAPSVPSAASDYNTADSLYSYEVQ